ncbi:alpha/beta-hydrolase [Eremomyces bilateralis CBS 781.70]|uniref:Alpha/beta-hydrolase n=1 Tax=Eremomyces bilateralis CBS 781.70 TaxID=1392243 RepID=A0A6G1FS75_9PEZI|nr:alpha/beta-hydrolase [Eremomyces bilateralis CBS 781.70]KAF1808529.1 alpha/beta-hydrolase [Eremomyces bilateralis CBS 781.70]
MAHKTSKSKHSSRHHHGKKSKSSTQSKSRATAATATPILHHTQSIRLQPQPSLPVLPIRTASTPKSPPPCYHSTQAGYPRAVNLPQRYPPTHPPAPHWASTTNLAMLRPQTHPPVRQGHRPPDQRKVKWSDRLHLPSTVARPLHAASASVSNLQDTVRGLNDGANDVLNQRGAGYVGRAAGIYELCAQYLDDIITQIDGEVLGTETGRPTNTQTAYHPNPQWQQSMPYLPPPPQPYAPAAPPHLNHTLQPFAEPALPLPTSTYFSKVWLYSNSRLPPHLPPLKLYLPTYPLLTLAARHSLLAYSPPPPSNISTSPSTTTLTSPAAAPYLKSFILRTVPVSTSPHTHTVILSIRGSASFTDWSINLHTTPQPPLPLLDDPGNLTHGGFLAVAVAMLPCVARHLTTLLDGILAADLSRQRDGRHRPPKITLLLTGHSAGGAIASLLYAHLGTTTPACTSPLRTLRSRFRRIHCITFGAPPITLLPLRKPSPPPANGRDDTAASNPDWRSSLFFSFVNEGDPVARADPAVVRSLLKLYASSPPPQTMAAAGSAPRWEVPPGMLSCAGRIVLLRGYHPQKGGRAKKGRRVGKRSGVNEQ